MENLTTVAEAQLYELSTLPEGRGVYVRHGTVLFPAKKQQLLAQLQQEKRAKEQTNTSRKA
jgi:chaperonin cofactor prefoldin